MALRPDWLPALAAFEAAARHQNFAHAAEELHLTASAVSHHVRKLESRLGVSLFQRHARGVHLTVEGRQLADAASNALADMEGVLRALRADRGDAERVRITTLHSWLNAWLLPRLPRFAERHPRRRGGDHRLESVDQGRLTRGHHTLRPNLQAERGQRAGREEGNQRQGHRHDMKAWCFEDRTQQQ